MADYLKLDTDALEFDGLVKAYQRAAYLDSEAKAKQAAYRDAIVAQLAEEHGASAAGHLLDIAPSTVTKHTKRHKERTMWTLPDNPAIRAADDTGHAVPPPAAPWWVKTFEPEAASPTLVYVMRADEEWLTYRCASSWHRTDPDELADGIQAATGIARALVAEAPGLVKVGKDTADALQYGDAGRDLDTGELPGEVVAADRTRVAAVQDSWERVRPVLAQAAASLSEEDFAEWAHEVMRGSQNGLNTVL